ncbi:alpha/beta hydrolase [Oscillatoria sp. CS-180]|nr:alpha/beta hydrolase [Oscillatoria sp. CS-180]
MILKNPDGTQTYFEAVGNKTDKPVLLLHGIGADHTMWYKQVKTYTDAGYYLLIPDLFGHGQSSDLASSDLSVWRHQLNWLLESQGVDKCHLIGVSMGGVIAQSFITEHPTKIEKMVISDSFGELRTFKERLLGQAQLLGFHLYKILGNPLLASSMRTAYKATYAQDARDYFEQVSLRADLNQMILARKAINQIDVLEKLRTVTTPTLVMVGADFGQTFIEINAKIADALPNSELFVLERAMDPSNLVNPNEFDRQVLHFLDGNCLDTPPD